VRKKREKKESDCVCIVNGMQAISPLEKKIKKINNNNNNYV